MENEQANDAMDILNEMLATWSAKGWVIPYIVQESFSGSGATSYTIGDGATWSTDRPLDILGGFIRDSNSTDIIIFPMPRDRYNDLSNKSGSSRASRFYYYKSYTTGTVYFDGVVASGETVFLDLQKPLAEISTLDTTIALPPEYAHLIRYQLMIRLAPEYRRKVTPEIAALARDSMETIINSNAEHEIAFLDRALQSGGPYSLRSING